jgi:hypothetical protein
VVEADALARFEHVDVDSQLAERPFPLEVAVEAEATGITPTSLLRVDDEPTLDVGDEPVLRRPERRLGNHRGP